MKRRKKGSKSKTATTKANTTDAAAWLLKLREERAGKPGRPPTTGEYIGYAEAKRAANEERERELRLEREVSIFSTEEALDLLKKGRLFPEDHIEEAKLNPTADIASRVREAQVEIIRISKISDNLKSDLQRAFRVQAALTMGLVDVFRTRADTNGQRTREEEVRRLRKQVEKLSKAQESIDEKINTMKSEAEAAKTKAKREEG